jgi:cell division protein FtsB
MSEENRLESWDAAADETEAGEEMTEFGPEAETAVAETEHPSEEDVESAVPQAVPQPDARPQEPAPPPGAVPKAPKPVTRARVFWTSFGLGFLFFVLAVAVSLGILVAFNGGLWYASPDRVVTLSRQVDGLTTQIDAQAQDLAGLRARLDNLEGLSGRIDEVEAATDGLQADVAELQTHLEELGELAGRVDAVQAAADQLQSDAGQLQSEVQALGAEVETLQEQGGRLLGFLEGLRDLLDGLFPKEERP